LSLYRAVQLLAEKPAEIFGLVDRGILERGKKADFVVVDFNKRFKIDALKFQSKAKFSPFNGWEVQGNPLKTFVNGRLVMDNQEIVAKPGSGSLVRRPQT
jgi:dihydroorotase